MVNWVGTLGLSSDLKYWIIDPRLKKKDVLKPQVQWCVDNILLTVVTHQVGDFATQVEKAMQKAIRSWDNIFFIRCVEQNAFTQFHRKQGWSIYNTAVYAIV